MGERQQEGSRFNEKWKTVASTQLKDVVCLLMDVFPELNLRLHQRVATNAIHKQVVDSVGSENKVVFKMHAGVGQN